MDRTGPANEDVIVDVAVATGHPGVATGVKVAEAIAHFA
jgi:hypothetical protein